MVYVNFTCGLLVWFLVWCILGERISTPSSSRNSSWLGSFLSFGFDKFFFWVNDSDTSFSYCEDGRFSDLSRSKEDGLSGLFSSGPGKGLSSFLSSWFTDERFSGFISLSKDDCRLSVMKSENVEPEDLFPESCFDFLC